MRDLQADKPGAGFERIFAMVERRIRPYLEQVALRERREELRRLSRRNQALGLVLVAGAILAWWLFHTRPGWIFPTGWWRL